MSVTFRRTRLERFIERLEARMSVHKNASWGSHGFGRNEASQEIIAELKREFKIREESN